MALMQITIVPMGTGSTSVGEYVAGVQKLLQEREFSYELGDMGTVIHGTPAELLRLAAELHEYPFTRGVQRVVTNIMIDDRRDCDRAISEKRRAVLKRLEGEQ
jgi:uncharacterized protein (TIGR00106 family)